MQPFRIFLYSPYGSWPISTDFTLTAVVKFGYLVLQLAGEFSFYFLVRGPESVESHGVSLLSCQSLSEKKGTTLSHMALITISDLKNRDSVGDYTTILRYFFCKTLTFFFCSQWFVHRKVMYIKNNIMPKEITITKSCQKK